MKNTRYAVQYRRVREGRTDYKRRTKLLLSNKPRAIIRRTLTRIIIQITEPAQNGDKVLVGVDSSMLEKLGWKKGPNISTAYLTGYLAGMKAKSKKVNEAVLDMGFSVHTSGGRLYAALKGMVDAGLQIPHDPEIFPKEDRIKGKHIGDKVPAEFDATKGKIKV
jgi:large subunit ribosomal protein L18